MDNEKLIQLRQESSKIYKEMNDVREKFSQLKTQRKYDKELKILKERASSLLGRLGAITIGMDNCMSYNELAFFKDYKNLCDATDSLKRDAWKILESSKGNLIGDHKEE